MGSLKKIAQQKGWECQKNFFYGKEDNYLITARQHMDYLNSANSCKLVYFPLINITQEQASNTLNYLRENKKDLKIRDFEFINHVLVIKLAEGLGGYSLEQFNNLISSLISFFKSNEIASESKCIYCNNGEVDSVTKIDKITYYAHSECIRKAQADLVQAKENFNQTEKNYGRGMFGAIFGAIVGAIPWMVLEIFWGFAAILSLAIVYAAFYGYKKFGGLVTKTTKYLMIIPILLAVVVSNFVSITYVFIVNDIPVSIEYYIAAYTDSEIGPMLLENILLGLVFVLLGYVYIFRKIKSEEFNTKIE